MPAPTAKKAEVGFNSDPAVPLTDNDYDEEILDASAELPTDADLVLEPVTETGNGDTDMIVDEENRPRFAPGKDIETVSRSEMRKVLVPPHRFSATKAQWSSIFTPLVSQLKLQVRMNPHRRVVEMRSSKHTSEDGALQKGEDFVKAFMLGFEVDDAIALLRLDDIYIESFEIKDVKQVMGSDAQSRAIGRIAGKDGKTKFAIENAAKARISLNGSRISILGTYDSIRLARESVVSLILGKPPAKVYGNLRTVAARKKERF